MVGRVVCPFVGDHGPMGLRLQRRESSRGKDDAVPEAGKAVRRGAVVLQYGHSEVGSRDADKCKDPGMLTSCSRAGARRRSRTFPLAAPGAVGEGGL